jgi:CubicO group peptidase (beta-lactamase class C family)
VSQEEGSVKAIDTVLKEAVSRRRVAGVAAAVATRQGVVYEGAFGTADVANGVGLGVDSIFRIASMTKAVTSVAALQLVERGAIRLDDDAAKHVPELGDVRVLERFDAASGEPVLRPPARPISVRHLLTHTSGFSYEMWSPEVVAYREQTGLPSVMDAGDGFMSAPLLDDPGARWDYSISTDWLGRLVERVSGSNLDDYLRQNVLGPLAMHDSLFELPPEKLGRLATVQQRQADGSLGELPFGPPTPNGFYEGGGGLVSTAGDYLRLLRMLLDGGALDGTRILEERTVQRMGEGHIGDLPLRELRTTNADLSRDVDFFPGVAKTWGLGFLVNTEPLEGRRTAGSLSWAGFFNTYYWIDRTTGVCGTILMQMLPFFDTEALALYDAYERAVYSSVSER